MILVSLALLGYLRRANTETFLDLLPQNGGLKTPMFEQAYKLNGIEKCAALQYPSMTASNIIETGRLREWKPTSTHPKLKASKEDSDSHSYCYYYMDEDKVILQGTDAENSAILAPVYDPMMVGACSTDPATGSLWSKFTGLIKDAFVDKEIDANHKLPYKKCVLKVASSNELEKQKLWKHVEEESLVCKGALEAVQKEYNRYVAQLRKLEEENAVFRRNYGTRDTLGSNLRTCTAQSNEIAENLIPMAKQLTQKLQQQILNDRSQLDTQIQQITTQQHQLDKTWEKVISDIVLNTRMRDTLQESIAKLTDTTNALNIERNKCRQKHKDLMGEVDKRTSVVEELKKQFNELEKAYNMCKEDLDATNQGIATMQKQQVQLKEDNKNFKIKLEACAKEKQIVTIEEAAWRKKAESLRAQYEVCSKERAKQQALYDGYVAQADALTQEIEDIKRRCRTVENEFYKANLETARNQAATTIDSTRTYCANVSAMKAKKAALMDELCELNARVKAKASEPQPCNDENRKTQCCPYKVKPGTTVGIAYQGSWRMEGNTARFNTSEATINRVRDNFKDGDVLGIEGHPTKVFKLVGTHKDKTVGKEEWIKVSSVDANLGSIQEFRALQKPWVTVTNPPPIPYGGPPTPTPDPPLGQGDAFC